MSKTKTDQPTARPYDLFILVLTILSLFTSAWLYLFSTDFQENQILVTLDRVYSIIFLLDFLVILYRTPDKRTYLKWGWMDLLGSLPTLAWTRPFRLVRAIRIIRRIGLQSPWQVWQKRRASSAFWATGFVVLFMLMASSLLILRFEQVAPSRNIVTAHDALWWAFVTITTVGYGDRYPTTEAGRLLAALLMTVGVGLFGILTSYLATNFLAPNQDEQENSLKEVKIELAEIKQTLQKLEEHISKE